MKNWFSAAGILAQGALIAKVGAIMFGLSYLTVCEVRSRSDAASVPYGWQSCWAIGGAIMGLPIESIAEKSGFIKGFNTYNPELRRKRKEEEEQFKE